MTPHRIVLTGGPGGGKSTAARLLSREYAHRAVLVPEAATLLFSGGFPRGATAAAQKAIFHLQQHMEEAFSYLYPEQFAICDRGTLDGAAYWPQGSEDFYRTFDLRYEQELSRYSAVIFMESAATGGMEIDGDNPTRKENEEEARGIDRRLSEIWSPHPNLIRIPHSPSFFLKIQTVMAAVRGVLP
jgi:predicted ATPase